MANLQNLSALGARALPTTEEGNYSKRIISGIDEEIQDLETKLQGLRQKRQIYASYISPLRCLPTEILSEVLSIALNKGVTPIKLAQICSRIRHVVLGMTTFWSKILLQPTSVGGGFRYHEGHLCMQYYMQDPLEFTIERAGSTPLDLYLSGSFTANVLKPITSRNLKIRSLTCSYLESLPDTIMDLNLSYLSRLDIRVSRGATTDAEKIMDLLLQSTQGELELVLWLDPGEVGILEHPLPQRVSRLEIQNGEQRLSFGSVISMPRLKSLRLSARFGLLEAMNLSHIEELTLSCYPQTWYAVKPTAIPIRLSELSLERLSLNRSNPIGSPCCLPQLKRLNLNEIAIRGSLRDYLSFPKLTYLAVNEPRFLSKDGQRLLREKEAATVFSDELFFQSVPELETLSLSSMTVNRKLINCLHFCPMFRNLLIDTCSIKSFISSFIEVKVHSVHLLALQELTILDSWPLSMSVSFLEFIACLSITRPDIQVFGNRGIDAFS